MTWIDEADLANPLLVYHEKQAQRNFRYSNLWITLHNLTLSFSVDIVSHHKQTMTAHENAIRVLQRATQSVQARNGGLLVSMRLARTCEHVLTVVLKDFLLLGGESTALDATHRIRRFHEQEYLLSDVIKLEDDQEREGGFSSTTSTKMSSLSKDSSRMVAPIRKRLCDLC